MLILVYNKKKNLLTITNYRLISLSDFYFPVFLSTFLSLSLSVCLSLSLSASLSVCLCLCLPVCLPVCLSPSLSLPLQLYFFFIILYIYIYIYIYIYTLMIVPLKSSFFFLSSHLKLSTACFTFHKYVSLRSFFNKQFTSNV